MILLLLAQVAWQTDHAAALQAAAERRAPGIVYFRADSCKRSRALEEGPFADAGTAALLNQFTCVRIDVDRDEPNIRAKYGVRFTPTIVFLGRDGKRLGEYEGAFEKEAMAAKLRSLLELHRSPWCTSEAAAMERGKEEKRFVLLSSEAKPCARVAAVLAEAADGFAIATAETPADAWVIVDASGEKPRVVAVIALKQAKPEELREAVKKATRK